MNYLKQQRQNKAFRVTVWTILSAFVSLVLTKISGMDREYVPFITLAIREVMKYVNVTYFGDIGVDKNK